MNKKLLRGWCFFLLVMFINVSCEKAGPQGPEGNANIKSMTATVTFTTPFAANWSAGVVDNDITQAIVDKGAVFVYVRANSTAPWTPIPFTSGSTYFNFYYAVGGVTVISSTQGTQEVKIVAAAGN